MSPLVECGLSTILAKIECQVARKRILKIIKIAAPGLPLVGVVGTEFFHLTQFSQQFMILIILVWVQAFFIYEIFLPGK